MRIKKRYLLLVVIVLLIGSCRLEFFNMRSSDLEFRQELEEKGVKNINFYDYEVDGRNMHYVHVGKENRPLLILVHGTPGSSSAFGNYLADSVLRANFQLVSVDRPGLGFSGIGKTEPSLERQAACIKPIIDRHPASRVILLGHSFGGPVIVRMAMDYPDLIDGMVIVAGSVSPELEPREWWRAPLDLPIVRDLLPPSLKVSNQEIKALYEELLLMEPHWEKIRCATLIYQGTEDKLVPMGNAIYTDSMLVNSPKKQVEMIEGGNHFILWSRMDEIVASTVDMFAREPEN